MKFVFDEKTQQWVPENLKNRLTATPIQIQVFRWLDDNPGVCKELSYSTRSISDEFFAANPDVDTAMREDVRDAVAMWYNDNHNIADASASAVREVVPKPVTPSEEDCGASAVPASVDALSIPSPVLPKKDKEAKESFIDTIPEENKNGNCFQEAWKAFYDNIAQKPLLVHAIITGQGPLEGIKYVHAWVEIRDTVIDKTIPLFKNGFPRDAYYRMARIDENLIFKYDSKQIRQKAEEWGTYGPWEDILWEYSY